MDILTVIARWLALSLIFLFMTYLFRDRVTIEGLLSYAVMILLFIPINVYILPITRATKLLSDEMEGYFIYFSAFLFVLNVLSLFAWSKIVPGLTFTSVTTLFFFTVIFTVLSFLISRSPHIPDLNLGHLSGSL